MADHDNPDPPPFERGSDEASLAFDIAFALPRSGIRGLRRAFTEDERYRIGRHIVGHLKLCGWRFGHDPPAVGHGTRQPVETPPRFPTSGS